MQVPLQNARVIRFLDRGRRISQLSSTISELTMSQHVPKKKFYCCFAIRLSYRLIQKIIVTSQVLEGLALLADYNLNIFPLTVEQLV